MRLNKLSDLLLSILLWLSSDATGLAARTSRAPSLDCILGEDLKSFYILKFVIEIPRSTYMHTMAVFKYRSWR